MTDLLRASCLFDTLRALQPRQEADLELSLWLGPLFPNFRERSKEASSDLSHPLPQCHFSQHKVTSAPGTQLARTG